MAEFKGFKSLPYKKMHMRKRNLPHMHFGNVQQGEKYSMIQIRNNVIRRKKAKRRTLSQQCIDAYNTKWNRCLLLEDDTYTTVNEIFEYTANASEIVGYYLVVYGPEAQEVWISNTKDKTKSALDKEVEQLFCRMN